MDKSLEVIWKRLIALMEKEQPEEYDEPITDIIVLAQKTLDKHPELGFKILIDQKTKQYKLTPRN